MILVEGKIVYEWGNTQKKHLVHSIRKALLNSIFGIYVQNGTIDTTQTIKELGIDDIAPKLTPTEKSARVADLLKSRSGIYHPAAAVSAGMLTGMPQRGSHQPNEAYYYNNWDFNVLGHILEQKTNQKIYDLFHKHIAIPLGMQYQNNYTTLDIKDSIDSIPDVDGFYQYEKTQSQFPAYHFRLSARDLALYGQLYLNRGKWNGNQIISKDWIEASTTPYSIKYKPAGLAYGMLWNVLMPIKGRPTKSFYHTGVGIHMLAIYPASKMVLVHRVATEEDYTFPKNNFYKMISLVWGAKEQ
jgi:CubicO group peptidase (beta-lactamase class C family)